MKNIVSERAQNIVESTTFAMSRRAKELIATGIDVIDLSVGEPDFKTPKEIQNNAINDIASENYFSYPPSAGYYELRELIVNKLKIDNSINCEIDQIIVTNGAKQALSDVFFCLLDPGDEVIIFSPYWVSYKEMVKLAEGKPKMLHGPKHNNYKVTAQQLSEAITPKTKVIIYSSPCNPSGAVFNKRELEEIAEVLYSHKNIFAIADEIYEYINFTEDFFSLGSIEKIANRVITINGFSKAFAMTGWRLGYMCAPKILAKACSRLHDQISFGSSTISQRAGIAAYKAGKTIFKDMINAYRERRDILIDLFKKKLPNFDLSKPEGAFYLFPDVSYYFGKSDGDKTINTAHDLAFYLLETARVSVVPGEGFGSTKCIRLSFASSKLQLIEAVDRIENALNNLK